MKSVKARTDKQLKSYTKEEKCPVLLQGKVIGWNIMMVTYDINGIASMKQTTFVEKKRNQ